MVVTVTTWSLEMRDRSALRPAPDPEDADVELRRARIPSPELSRFLYTAVGGDWHWTDRLSWSYGEWERWLDRLELETWVLSVSGTPAGYAELEMQEGRQVEIAYLGLLPRFTGRGLGGWLLTRAIERGWDMGATRVWVHTCTLDGPRALRNYQARGMTVFDERTADQQVGERPPGPWPGARAG
jgi:GNAT superfamily N-acetyltransferase